VRALTDPAFTLANKRRELPKAILSVRVIGGRVPPLSNVAVQGGDRSVPEPRRTSGIQAWIEIINGHDNTSGCSPEMWVLARII
jgi:hypothetical protein